MTVTIAPAARPGARLLWITGLGTVAVAPLVPRFAHGVDPAARESLSGPQLLFSQGVVLLVLIAAAALVTRQVFQDVAADTRPSRTGRGLAWAAVAFTAGPVLSAVFGEHGALDAKVVFAPLLFAALYLCPRRPFPEVLRQLRIILRCYVWGSLLSVLVAPGWAFLLPAHGDGRRDFLGLGWGQFTGLAPNPNHLGPLMAVALLLEVTPVGRWRGRAIHAAAALLALTLTQSRTGWICAASVFIVHGAWGRTALRRQLLTVFGGAAALMVLMAAPVQAALVRLAADPMYGGFNGRTLAWRLAYDEFERNPLFGYGPTLFSPAHRLELFGTTDHWIGQAHSQVMHTLGASGLIGFAGLCLLVSSLVVQARRASAHTSGLSTALVTLLIVACITEAPLRALDGLSAPVLLLTVVWCVLLHGTPFPTSATQEPSDVP
ncbi:O-antigen ligase family protein [Streptomyces sp. NPDC057136]|uniref:O-antigen ligase family protein n=1 Tax=Streptomyces sp. NPDC057136 TaxID=3346029 RepID=UPI00363A7D8C